MAPLFGAWMKEYGLTSGLFSQQKTAPTVHWFWDGFEHVDPSKEATAQEKRLANRTTTLAAEYAKLGKDWEEELRQWAAEQKFMCELGIELKSAASSRKESPEEDDEMEESHRN